MSKAFRDYFSRQFSINKKHGDGSILAILHENKSRQPVDAYADLIKALTKTVPDIANDRRFKGRVFFRDLLWNSSGDATTLTREFAFARVWLQGAVETINKFRETVNEIQNALLNDDYDQALAKVVEHRRQYGWTIWGVEIEFAIATISMTAKETRNYLSNLTDKASPRIASLFGQIVRDRNDPSLPISGFIAKCLRSFPRVGISLEAQQYLLYRSHGYIQNFNQAPSVILTADLANSLIDYYETLVDICATLVVENVPSDVIEEIRLLTDDLVKLGIEDFRLKKVNFSAGGFPHSLKSQSTSAALEHILEKALSFSLGGAKSFPHWFQKFQKKLRLCSNLVQWLSKRFPGS